MNLIAVFASANFDPQPRFQFYCFSAPTFHRWRRIISRGIEDVHQTQPEPRNQHLFNTTTNRAWSPKRILSLIINERWIKKNHFTMQCKIQPTRRRQCRSKLLMLSIKWVIAQFGISTTCDLYYVCCGWLNVYYKLRLKETFKHKMSKLIKKYTILQFCFANSGLVSASLQSALKYRNNADKQKNPIQQHIFRATSCFYWQKCRWTDIAPLR